MEGSLLHRVWTEKMQPHLKDSLVKTVSDGLALAYVRKAAVYHDLNVIGASVPTPQMCDFIVVWSEKQITQNSMIAQKVRIGSIMFFKF